jgi:predicted enzyme related to lactoylglutathione lyase
VAISWFSLDVDARDPAELARWWARALDYKVVWEEEAYVAIARDDRTHPGLIFNRVAGTKTEKNRLHLDLNPDDHEREVQRLLELGAMRVDIGQGDVSWAVMADPEGNEFCVMTPWTHPDDIAS